MENKKKVRILSLDGGGIRGIISASIVKYIEEYLQKKKPGTSISDHFDFIAGTSTGGILTAIYLAPDDNDKQKAKYSASDALNFYIEGGNDIFNNSKISNWKRLWGLSNATTYSPQNLEKLLEQSFGNLKVSELLKPCLITTYNISSKSSYFFTSRGNPDKRDFLVRDALRSTSAAPTYFPPAKIKNIAPNCDKDAETTNMINLDGGVFATNPTMCAYAEARNTDFVERNNKEPIASEMHILSVGTGGGKFKLKQEEKSAKWNLLKWAKAIPDIMMDGSVDTVAFQMNEIHDSIVNTGSSEFYLRIDTPRDYHEYDPDMSNASPENITNLLKTGEKTIEDAVAKGLNQFLDGLLDD